MAAPGAKPYDPNMALNRRQRKVRRQALCGEELTVCLEPLASSPVHSSWPRRDRERLAAVAAAVARRGRRKRRGGPRVAHPCGSLTRLCLQRAPRFRAHASDRDNVKEAREGLAHTQWLLEQLHRLRVENPAAACRGGALRVSGRVRAIQPDQSTTHRRDARSSTECWSHQAAQLKVIENFGKDEIHAFALGA